MHLFLSVRRLGCTGQSSAGAKCWDGERDGRTEKTTRGNGSLTVRVRRGRCPVHADMWGCHCTCCFRSFSLKWGWLDLLSWQWLDGDLVKPHTSRIFTSQSMSCIYFKTSTAVSIVLNLAYWCVLCIKHLNWVGLSGMCLLWSETIFSPFSQHVHLHSRISV